VRRGFSSNLFVRYRQYRLAAVAAAVVAWMLCGVSAFAQSKPDRRSNARLTLRTLAPVISPSAVRVYEADSPESSVPDEIPSNLKVSKDLKPTVEMMLRRSGIFRRQCLRIANAPWLTVTIGRFHPLPSERANALTRFVREDGQLLAEIRIAPLSPQVELIAHELEHVIEQLDGVDLRTHASLRRAAASVGEDGSFETVRAIRQGLAVTREIDGSR
jgi:hypothetical protein